MIVLFVLFCFLGPADGIQFLMRLGHGSHVGVYSDDEVVQKLVVGGVVRLEVCLLLIEAIQNEVVLLLGEYLFVQSLADAGALATSFK